MGGQSLAIGTRKKAFSRIIFSNAALLVLLGLVIFNSIFTKNFANANTVSLLIRQSASIFCVAMGMSFVIATGNIDISVGPMMALAAILCVKIEEATGSYLFGILGALGVCVVSGAANGLMVSVFNIQSMIATLITQMVFRAAAQLISAWVITIRGDTVRFLGLHMIGGTVPIQIVPVAVLALLTWFLLKKTIFGKRLEAVGCNQKGARISGINTIVVMLVGYILCSVCAGLAGLIELFRSAACDTSTFGNNYEIKRHCRGRHRRYGHEWRQHQGDGHGLWRVHYADHHHDDQHEQYQLQLRQHHQVHHHHRRHLRAEQEKVRESGMNEKKNAGAASALKRALSSNGSILIVLLLLLYCGLRFRGDFLNPTNLLNILRQLSITGIAAIGVNFVIISGGRDLSVGSVAAVTAVIAAFLTPYGLLPTLLGGLAVGLLFGLFNGFIITYLGVTPLIGTLGTQWACAVSRCF